MSYPVEDEVYLVEIWQNVNGQKAVWHEVMTRHKGNWVLHSDPNKTLGPTQADMKWVKIKDITNWELPY